VILGFSTASEFDFKLEYKPKSRSKKTYEVFHAKNYTVRNRSAQGIKLTDREITRFEILTTQEPDKQTQARRPRCFHGTYLQEKAK